jgi:hypothetical protein
VKTEDEQKFLTDATRSEDRLGEPKITTETEGERNQKTVEGAHYQLLWGKLDAGGQRRNEQQEEKISGAGKVKAWNRIWVGILSEATEEMRPPAGALIVTRTSDPEREIQIRSAEPNNSNRRRPGFTATQSRMKISLETNNSSVREKNQQWEYKNWQLALSYSRKREWETDICINKDY